MKLFCDELYVNSLCKTALLNKKADNFQDNKILYSVLVLSSAPAHNVCVKCIILSKILEKISRNKYYYLSLETKETVDLIH